MLYAKKQVFSTLLLLLPTRSLGQIDTCPEPLTYSPDDADCLNGGTCQEIELEGGVVGMVCNCQSAQLGSFSTVGHQCEVKAEVSCEAGREFSSYSFCVNGGVCKSLVQPEEPHPLCDCSDGFEGRHCQFAVGTAPQEEQILEPKEKTPVVISHQGPLYWVVPIYIAEVRGYFESLLLNVSYEVYSSGAPQVAAAVDSMSWDIGAAGVVPNIIGAPRGIETVGISNDESATNALAGTAAWPPNPDSETSIILTANSTVHYAAEACLAKEGLKLNDLDFSFAAPAGVLEALANDSVGYGGLWAPNLYLYLESKTGSKIVCSGKDAGAIVPGGIMVRKEFGEGNGEIVAKVLAAWLRGIEYLKGEQNRNQVLAYMRELYGSYNVTIYFAAQEQEIDLRPIYGLDEQLALMNRDAGPSTVDQWYEGVSDFMFKVGVLDEDPAAETYITSKYMQMVADDPELRSFALLKDVSAPGTTNPTSAPTTSSASLTASTLACCVLVSGIIGITMGSL